MIEQNSYREVSTKLDLNGPILSFTTQPVGIATTVGANISLVGIATATFPNAANNSGAISYRWYEVGFGALSDTAAISGTATTTLTISNLTSPADNGRRFYLQVDYLPSLQTGNAINEPLISGITTITVYPTIQIISQPSNRSITTSTNTTFTVSASLSDASFTESLNYQWQLNGENINDGQIVISSPSSSADITYFSDSNFTLPEDSSNVEITVAGAMGGTGGDDYRGMGGSGGNGRVGNFNLPDGGRNLSFRIGRRGNSGTSGNQFAFGTGGLSSVASGGKGGGAGQSGSSGGGAGGGGATGVYDNSSSSYLIVSGGGGGGGGGSYGRDGLSGNISDTFNPTSETIAISEGGSGTTMSGDGAGGGGGGGGSLGGAGGASGGDETTGGFGGFGGGSKYNSGIATLRSQWENSGDGYVNLKFTTNTDIPEITIPKTKITTISGSKTPTLTINSNVVGIQTVRCIISSPTATNSPVISNIANFVTVSTVSQFNIQVEAIGVSTSATISSINLFNGDYEFSTSLSDPNGQRIINSFSIYAPDRDLDVEMDLYGGKGYNFGSYVGGQGGFSRIRFTMEKDVEYVIAGLTTSINTPFVYRKGTLIAAVGGGGNAGNAGSGGFGGGIGISGESGFSRGSGSGGQVYLNGTLPTNGVFGSSTTLVPLVPDTKASIPNSGRVIPCTRGIYWNAQGLSPCQDIGISKFRLLDGTIVTNTAEITRGFKAGYGINETAGKGAQNSGDGGHGATGGNGGTLGAGGGGGSGYSDGSVNIITSTLGGSNGNARVILRIVN